MVGKDLDSVRRYVGYGSVRCFCVPGFCSCLKARIRINPSIQLLTEIHLVLDAY